MTDATLHTAAEVADLETRVRKLARDKSHLELILRLINKMTAVPGLDNTIHNMLKAVGDVIGGINVILYYLSDGRYYYVDVYDKKETLQQITDPVAREVLETHEPRELQHEFANTMMLTREFTKAFTWGFPLVVGREIIGVFKIESSHVGLKELDQHLPIFFAYAALVLKNEILSHSRLRSVVADLEREVVVRKHAEQELRRANDTLEERVARRTKELQDANTHLLGNERLISSLLEQSEVSRQALMSTLLEARAAEAALRLSEQNLNHAQSVAHMGSWILDINTTEIDWSPETRRIFETPPGERITLDTFINFLFMDDVALVYAAWIDALKGSSFDFEHRLFVNNKIKWVHERAEIVFDCDGVAIKCIGTIQDTTERKLADDALRRSELEKSIRSRIAQVFLTTPDREMYGGVLRIVEEAMQSEFGLFGYIDSGGDLVAPSLTERVWDQCEVAGKSIVFPSNSWGNSIWGEAIRSRRPKRCEGPFSMPEGHIPILYFLTVPIVYGSNTIGLISVGDNGKRYDEADQQLLEGIADYISPILHERLQRDLHEQSRREAEEALRESEEKYRLLVANANEAIFVAQENGVIFPNRKTTELTGYSTEELAGISLASLVHPTDQVSLSDSGLPGTEHPFRLQNKAGEERWAQLNTAPITWEGKPGTLCFLRDFTAQKALESQFLQAQKMDAVGRLAGGVAHDFNNMLSIITGFAELAMGSVREGDPFWGHLQEIRRAGERAAALTRQLLAFSRKQVLSPEVVSLNGLTYGMEKMLKRLIGEDIELVTDMPEGLWRIKADPGQIEQVIMNLAVNARDAMPRGGKLTLQTANAVVAHMSDAARAGVPEGEHVTLTVADTGCGMPPDVVERIFEPFFTTKELGKGTGLGLATVYGIVQQSNGSIQVYSAPGVGTTFTLYFPRVEQSRITEKRAPSVVAQGAGETVLVVEDEDAVRRLVVHVLEHRHYQVLAASNGGEALLVCERHQGKIDLLLADVIMPQMGGRELAERLLLVRPEMRVLYVSGYSDKEIALDDHASDGTNFLHKPFQLDQLLAKIREVLDSR